MPTIMRNGVATYVSIQEYNDALAKHRNQVLGIDTNSGKLKHYNVEDLGKIWINGQEFSGMAYQGFSTVNTKTYVEEPKRANDGSIPNINDYDTFVVPRCTINFKYLNIYDYQRLCEAVQSNEFYVEYYDKQFVDSTTGTLLKVKHKMYAEPEEMAKLYNVGTDVFGVLDYDVSFIGTLNDLEEYNVIFDGNGADIFGSPTVYNSSIEYKKGDRVYIEDSVGKRYFEAIWYSNSFKNDEGQIELTNTEYWSKHDLFEYVETSTYEKGNVVYQNIINDKNEQIGRRYYIALQYVTLDSNGKNRPLTDTSYWQMITAKTYNTQTTYSSNKTSSTDTVLGQFALNTDGTEIYEAIYYKETFSGYDPTNTTYWMQLALGEGVKVQWGNSIVVPSPMELFNAPTDKVSNRWSTIPDGTGYIYNPTQSLNVFKNLTLYAIWE